MILGIELPISKQCDNRYRITYPVNSVLSNWADIHKGVPQGSILGPLLFNVFINDIFLFITDSSLYNYADDNTLPFGSPDFDLLISSIYVFFSKGSYLLN